MARNNYKQNGRKHNLKYKFSLTPERLAQMRADQNNRCYLCEDPLPSRSDIDHDHACCPGPRSCGRCVRGIACGPCNRGIAKFRDDPERMRRVADNLERKLMETR